MQGKLQQGDKYDNRDAKAVKFSILIVDTSVMHRTGFNKYFAQMPKERKKGL